MDILTITGVVMLIFWAAGSFAYEAPGIIHLFLSLGVMLIVLGAVKRSERARKSTVRRDSPELDDAGLILVEEGDGGTVRG
jgi:hypothetical protein